jgi:hypothetical protein
MCLEARAVVQGAEPRATTRLECGPVVAGRQRATLAAGARGAAIGGFVLQKTPPRL